jgi:hypothetical protein
VRRPSSFKNIGNMFFFFSANEKAHRQRVLAMGFSVPV